MTARGQIHAVGIQSRSTSPGGEGLRGGTGEGAVRDSPGVLRSGPGVMAGLQEKELKKGPRRGVSERVASVRN